MNLTCKRFINLFFVKSYKRLVWHNQQPNSYLINLSDEPLDYLTGKEIFPISASVNRYLFSAKRLWTSLKILFSTKHLLAITNILPGGRNRLKHLLRKKTLYKRPKQMLTHFMPLVSFYTPWKYQKAIGFLMFSGCIERDQWNEMS